MARNTTVKQRWAQKRNWSKYRLMGVKGQLQSLCYSRSSLVTDSEISELDTALRKVESVLDKWSNRSRRLGLKR